MCYIVTTDEPDIDKRYKNMVNYLTKSPWRKKAIVVLTAEKSNISQRTAHEWLKYLEEQGVAETVQISRNRVFMKSNSDHQLAFELETENKSKVESLLEKTHRLAISIIKATFPSRSKYETSSNSNLFPDLGSLVNRFKSNTLPPKELKELEDNIGELNELCREELVVIHEDPHLNHIFQIFDCLVFLWKNYDEIDNTDYITNWLTLTTDLTEISKMYLSFLREMSLNADLVGYGDKYDERLSDRLSELQPIIETGPNFIRENIYYLIHSHGDTSQRIDAFITNIKNQENLDYEEVLSDVHSLYAEEEIDDLRDQLSTIADELNGQQRSIVERLCSDIEYYDGFIQLDTRIKYYNRSKRKIIATLSHGPEKLENISRFSTESKPNISSNITSLCDDGYVDKIEEMNGHYALDKELQKLFQKRREKTLEAKGKEVRTTLEQMASRREEHVYPKGAPIYDDEDEFLQRHQQPPWLKLHSFSLDSSFVLKEVTELNSFFEILDDDIDKMQKTDKHFFGVSDGTLAMIHIAEALHRKWYRGLENIHYHSALFKRLADLKEAHNCVPPSERKHIRHLISTINLGESEALFKQALVDNQETTEDLKMSIEDIYYKNNQMHKIVEFLSSENKDAYAGREETRKELLEYSIDIPYKNKY